MVGGDLIAPAWLLSHETGHSIQLKTGMGQVGNRQSELSADCLSGYFLGGLQCTGEASQANVQNALMTACSIGDPSSMPWFAPGSHGSCLERVNAVTRGMQGYAAVARPSVICAYANFQ
jgi:uncharacterized protein